MRKQISNELWVKQKDGKAEVQWDVLLACQLLEADELLKGRYVGSTLLLAKNLSSRIQKCM